MKRDMKFETTKKTRTTCYCFTYNNYTEEGETALKAWLEEKTKYAVFGHEVGESGTPHLQGYMSLIKSTSTQVIQNQLTPLGIKLALFYAKGNPAQNLEYCSKQDKDGYWQHGKIETAGKGARTDLAAVVKTIQTPGITLKQVAKAHPEAYIKYNGIARLHAVYEEDGIEEFRDITVTVYYGTGGTGKTRKAVNDCKRLGISYYILNAPARGATLYYQRYNGEKALIIDDFYGWITPHELFRILDRYKLIVRVLYGDKYARWTYVFFTSNVHPNKFYKPEVFDKLDSNAWERRFHNIYLFDYANPEHSAVRNPEPEKEVRKIIFPVIPEELNQQELEKLDLNHSTTEE